MTNKKSNKKANKYRAIGNDLFKDGRFLEALLAYNHSLLFAETGSVELALAYGNRSAVYVAIEKFQLCLENIQLARAHGYPSEKIQKLEERKKICEESLKMPNKSQEGDRSELFKLSFPSNSKVPGLADCIELKYSKKLGSRLITNRDLKAGDIIAVIEPTCLVFDKRARLHHCSHCGTGSKILSLIPCPNCTRGKQCSVWLSLKVINNFYFSHVLLLGMHGLGPTKISSVRL
jgi:hypothetical protein